MRGLIFSITLTLFIINIVLGFIAALQGNIMFLGHICGLFLLGWAMDAQCQHTSKSED